MAISRRFPVPFDLVFPYGAYLVSEVTAVSDYEKSTRESKIQSIDPDTGLLLWQVDVLDADPEAKRSAKTVSVKIPAKVQPVPPANDTPFPFTPVAFDGMTALPWIEESGNFTKISWSLRAVAIIAPRVVSSSNSATSKTATAA
jgi:hypothetical protein